MGVILEEPKHKVLDPSPSLKTTVSNFTALDLLKAAAFTGAAVAVGYSTAPAGIKKQAVVTCATIGGTAGFFNAYQNSAGRLMGYFPNGQ
ncbi:21 kDa subunit of NADH-ubiquinone oxidoreductase complex I [Chloropicon roscoffensis]|uniref:21 kDa subunit of NADH-ubiquinone oxidoreductase complex I n=2 Tax=Chloropicon roscoffensis TaxID=1461544 RepID=A0AAX4NZH0_9CHLO|mmetsp:Transcript_6215/g.18830  ORF Transcript_6215/g.18830 Transcript_6215/m.18830 type:complete len:90 (+) Transcript_6215:188-457(+)